MFLTDRGRRVGGNIRGGALGLAVAALFTLALLGTGCSGGGDAPEDHNVDLGAMHMVGYETPLFNCTACHGAELDGGEGPSCYNCHNNDDHTRVRDGVSHMDGSPVDCARCHGPGNRGGLGPACSLCHI